VIKCNCREASLKWHIEYEHKTRRDSDEESERDDDEESGADGVDQNFVVKSEPAPKRLKVHTTEGDRPFKCDICTCSFKEVMSGSVLQ
jgi:hypothetical protein